ncbi:MAG TPA: ABC transporter ATP-binding protein [bacterium]|nr:ABC transporter ATP-binding protein [bacterium]
MTRRIELNKISFRYPAAGAFGLGPLSLTVAERELVGLLGSNGAGKSTLVRLMAGLLHPDRGEVLWEGRSLRDLRAREKAQRIAYVPQSHHFPFPLKVFQIVEMGRHPYLGSFGPMGTKDHEICERALALCDAAKFKDRWFQELSGGERQRVLLASALAQTPQLLLLDEPTLSLDLSHQVLLFEIIRKLHREEGLTVVVATHELNMAGRFLDRLVLMKEGKILADGGPRKVLTASLIKRTLGVEVDRLRHGKAIPVFVPKYKEARS